MRFIPSPDDRRRLIKGLNFSMLGVGLLAVVSLIWEFGFYPTELQKEFLHALDFVIVTYFILEVFLKLILAPSRREYLKHNWLDLAFLCFFFLQVFIFKKLATVPPFIKFLKKLNIFSVTMGYIVLCQIYIVTHLVLQLIKVNKQIAALPIRPAQAVVLSFGIVILFGTFLLSLPRAVYGKQLSFIDALFTATSAVCVTGLNVVSLGDTFTYFGQGVILVLIQLGGLGLMTITAFFALVISRDLGIREHLLLRDILNYEILGNITRLLKYILGLTFICEGIGAVLFFLKWRSLFPESIAQAIYYSVFHAISAFCNAGFCLFENSFASFQGDIGTLGITAALIIIGGLGFAVVMNVLNLRIFTRKKRLFALTLQSKLVLIISGSLLILGTVVLLGLESENALKDFSFRKRLLTAFFHSVTARTAGFSTIDIGELSQGAILFLILLMFIGASPGSTGGGVKTSTIGLVLVALWNICCGRTKVELFKRNISWEIVNKAFVIVIIALIFIFLSTILLAVIEKSRPFMELLFEVFSAFGTVGLSCGVTPLLSPVGKAILVVTMFAGRIGPLTLALAIGQRVVKEHYQYPQAAIMIG